MQYKAYIFDYDYTLVFSEPAILMCFHHMFDASGLERATDEDIVRTIGMPLKDAISELTGIIEDKKLEDMRAAFSCKADEVMNTHSVFFPDTIAVLKKIKQSGCKVGIVSNKQRRRISQMLEMHGLMEYVDTIVGPEDFNEYKPDPEGLLLAMERLDIAKADTLFIGDSIIDALTAKNAEVNFIGVTTGTTTEKDFSVEPHKKIIRKLSELLD